MVCFNEKQTSMKVVITGPESTGKSWLTKSLARHYNIPFVEEYARMYLEQTDGRYSEKDLLKIARGQMTLEDQVTSENPGFVLCDTSLEVIRIWSEWKYGNCHPEILEQSFKRQPDLYLLLKPDVPWFPDKLRENPDDRYELYEKYRSTLNEYDAKIIEVGDYWEHRFHASIVAIDLLLRN